MLEWQFGEVTVKRLVEIEVPIPYDPDHPFMAEASPEALREIPWLFPDFVTPDGALKLSVHAFLVEACGFRLVVDTCLGNDKPRQAMNSMSLQTRFLEDLAEAGFSPETVDAVVCTHLHLDHVGWNTVLRDGVWTPTFPRAQYLIGRREYEHWIRETAPDTADQQALMLDSVKPVFDAGLAVLVESDHQISPEIRLTPTPGHTPGHVSVVISSGGETAIITGDMIHHPCQLARPRWATHLDFDTAEAFRTRQEFLTSCADNSTLVMGTHFAAPTAGHVLRDGDGFRLAPSASPGTGGVSR